MPRPKSKEELLELSNKNYQKLLDQINGFSQIEQERDFPPGTLNRNIRDVIAHLYHWHFMMLKWYEIGMKGEKPAMPAEGYTWKDTSSLNREINTLYSAMPLKEALVKFERSHHSVMGLVEKHSNDELFEKKRFTWTGSTSLGAYLISSTSSHYDWAIKLIRRLKK